MEVYILKLRRKITRKLEIPSIVGYFTTLDKAENAVNEISKKYGTFLQSGDYRFVKTFLDINLIIEPKQFKVNYVKVIKQHTNLSFILNDYTPNIITISDEKYIYCLKRNKKYMLTKEEEARQRFLFFLIVNCKYPLEFIEVEYSIKDENDNKNRTDIVIFNSKKEALIVIECKEGNVKLSQKVFDQVKKYNEVLKARHIIVANELYYSIRIFNDDKKRYEVISEMPKI